MYFQILLEAALTAHLRLQHAHKMCRLLVGADIVPFVVLSHGNVKCIIIKQKQFEYFIQNLVMHTAVLIINVVAGH